MEFDFQSVKVGSTDIGNVSNEHAFDFEQYQEPRRVVQPVLEYFKQAFEAPVDYGVACFDCNKPQPGVLFVAGKYHCGCVHTTDTAPEEKPSTENRPILSTDSTERKNTPIFSGVLMYFPLAIAAVARHSQRGNDKHNPGEPLHWAREKSTDHADCIARHLVDVEHFNAETGEYEEACALAWRALAKLQLLEEKRLGRSK